MPGGTNRWARAAFNDTDGWPTTLAFFRERLFYARGRTVFGSVVGLYDDFSRLDGPDITKETAIKLTLATDRLDLIRWLVGAQALLVGSSRAELAIKEMTDQQVFAADNATGKPQTECGSTMLRPLRVGNEVLFVQRSGLKMREMKYDYAVDSYASDELTVLSEHILRGGVVDMDYQPEPDNLVWCVKRDGTLAALTYNRERGVVGWAPHFIGAPDMSVTPAGEVSGYGIVETVASISSPDGTRDDVWIIVRRTIDGEERRFVEIMEDNRLAETGGLAQSFYLDAGISRLAGAPTTTITGLGHLNGTVVQVLADGNPQPPKTVTGGAITLDNPSVVVHVGYNAPARLMTMRAEGGSQGGTTQTKMKSLSEVWVRTHASLGGKVGPDFERMDELGFADSSLLVGGPMTLFSGDKRVAWPATYDTNTYICFEQDQPLPSTIVAFIGRLDIGEDVQ